MPRQSERTVSDARPRLLIFVVAYNAEKTIRSVLTRIPTKLGEEYETEILIIDDSSRDGTFEEGHEVKRGQQIPYPIHILHNPINQGYGGNQKIGYQYAIENGFDFVALVHGDGQYAPERLPGLVAPLRDGEVGAVFGSRMMTRGGALKGGMPLYKFVGNKILTWYENRMLRTSLSEFHSGYRVYRVDALQRIPFHLNTRDFHFDTEIIIQLVIARIPILELPIPTYYGDEISHVNGLAYAWHVTVATTKASLQELSLFYDRKFDCAPAPAVHAHYALKLGFTSSHTMALDAVRPGERVIDLGCAGGLFGAQLRATRGCHVTGVDVAPPAEGVVLDRFVEHDLDRGPPDLDYDQADVVLLLDVIEHLKSPEHFVAELAQRLSPSTRLVVTTGNVAFGITRLMLLFGEFNYGKRGILDLTHSRLFTFKSLRALFEQAGYRVLRVRGVPAPFPLAAGNNALGAALLGLNKA
ncbi:MAG: bifunctional glycosyltransferase/class I SAM-dependent methyltransferase, partial [Betaproteobacteria bacterium]|nr:bifunctional glycosyltransferase/class I SAM-dependent methyltransferase [Betaproteobacteria bacterium]